MNPRAIVFSAAFSLLTPSAFAADREPAAHASPATRAADPSETGDDLDRAFGEFKTSAERLGKSLAKAADEDTAGARKKIAKTMNGAILELSRAMDKASERFESSRPEKKPAPKPTP
jgi:hypothetical protein